MAYVTLVVWLRRRTPRARRALLLTLALCVVLPVIQQVVVTDREAIRGALGEMVAAVEAGEIEPIAARVARRFQVREIDREAFLAGVDRAMHRYHIERARLGGVEIEVAGDTATVRFTASGYVTSDMYTGDAPTAWTARFVLIDGRWMLAEVEPRRTALFRFDRLEQLIP